MKNLKRNNEVKENVNENSLVNEEKEREEEEDSALMEETLIDSNGNELEDKTDLDNTEVNGTNREEEVEENELDLPATKNSFGSNTSLILKYQKIVELQDKIPDLNSKDLNNVPEAIKYEFDPVENPLIVPTDLKNAQNDIKEDFKEDSIINTDTNRSNVSNNKFTIRLLDIS